MHGGEFRISFLETAALVKLLEKPPALLFHQGTAEGHPVARARHSNAGVKLLVGGSFNSIPALLQQFMSRGEIHSQ